MSEGIKDKVAIIGMGCTKFGERWDKSEEDLIIEAYTEALNDAGIEPKKIDAAWFGSCFDEINVGKSSLPLATTLKLGFKPVTRVENFCATGTEAFRGACYAVASGACDIAIAVGAEKLKDTGFGGLPEFSSVLGTRNRFIFPNITAPGAFAMLATAYFKKYGLSYEEGKRILAKISVKSHKNGLLNEKAHLRKEITVDDVLKAPIIASPLGLFDCSGVSDGAAVAIITRANKAKEYAKNPIFVKALQISVSDGAEYMYNEWDGTTIPTTVNAARKAYAEARIKNPRSEVDLMELHDCFSITELVTYEDLGISERGRAGEDVENGFFDLDGKIPSQTDGGLKCFGHPIAASGLRMIYEVYKQLQGKAGKRQVKNAHVGLTHNIGGFPAMSITSVAIFGND